MAHHRVIAVTGQPGELLFFDSQIAPAHERMFA
jgi:hypothetical protein